jgi:SAM-dependent methyltransferase
MPSVSPLRVNLGSGSAGIDGWINIDADPKLRLSGFFPFLKLANRMHIVSSSSVSMYSGVHRPPNLVPFKFGEKPLPFKNDSVQAVFTSHALEHFPRHVALSILKEAHRVLMPGGVLRVTVPDLELVTKLYLMGKGVQPNEPLPEGAAPMSTRDLNLMFYDKSHVNPVSKLDAIDFRMFGIHPHMYMYDYPELDHLLKEAGFSQSRKCKYKEGKCPDIDRLDNRPDITLYVEAEKS